MIPTDEESDGDSPIKKRGRNEAPRRRIKKEIKKEEVVKPGYEDHPLTPMYKGNMSHAMK